MVDYFSYWDSSFDFYYLLNEFLNNLYFWDFLNDLNNPLDNSGNFNSLFNDPFNLHNFFLGSWHDDGHFNGDWNFLFYFSNLLNFYNLLNNLFDWHDLRDLYDSVDNLFNDFLHFNNLVSNSEDFKNIVDIHNSHNFLIDHSNNSFIDFKGQASFSFNLLKFFKEGLKQDSKVELNFSGFF